MTVSAPKLRSARPRPPSRGQLRRLEQEISRFIRRPRANRVRLQSVQQWADGLLTRVRARWILLRAATTGPRKRLASAAWSLRKSLNPVRASPPRPRSSKPTGSASASPVATSAAASTSRLSRRERLESVILWLCCIFMVLCGILLFAAGRELRHLQSETADSGAQIRVLHERIAKLEKDTQTLRNRAREATQPPKTERNALTLTHDEEKLVRQFIKVLPSQPSGSTPVQPGQPLGAISTAPIPDALVEQIPRLSGARFSIDAAGAIIISRAGSSRADAVLAYSQ
jgi:hypothetical protein